MAKVTVTVATRLAVPASTGTGAAAAAKLVARPGSLGDKPPVSSIRTIVRVRLSWSDYAASGMTESA